MADVIAYNGEDRWKIRATQLLNQSGGGGSQEVYYNTTAGWGAQTTLVSQAGVIYVYSDYKKDSQNRDVPNIKVGDGQAYVVDLPFMNMDVTEAQITFWNNKVRCYIDPNNPLNVIFTTD